MSREAGQSGALRRIIAATLRGELTEELARRAGSVRQVAHIWEGALRGKVFSSPGAEAERRSRGASAASCVRQVAAACIISSRSTGILRNLAVSKHYLAPHFVPATCRSRAGTSVRAERRFLALSARSSPHALRS